MMYERQQKTPHLCEVSKRQMLTLCLIVRANRRYL